MYSIIFLLTAPTQDVQKIKDVFPVLLSQAKASNDIFTEFVLCFKESQDESILEAKLTEIGCAIFLCECLF